MDRASPGCVADLLPATESIRYDEAVLRCVSHGRQQSALADRSAALAEAERLKRDFVGNVSYELRTPLTTIIGYSELLERADGISERGRNHVAAVRAAATQLARSIDDVLDMAQIDAGEMALEIEDIRVSDLLLNAQERALKDAQLGAVTLAVECDEDVGLIRGDGKRLAQTLDHLVENALRQTPPGGRVTLSARRALGEMREQLSAEHVREVERKLDEAEREESESES